MMGLLGHVFLKVLPITLAGAAEGGTSKGEGSLLGGIGRMLDGD